MPAIRRRSLICARHPEPPVRPASAPGSAELFERLAGPLVVDLLWHLPAGIVDRRASPPIRRFEPTEIATLRVRVEAHEPGTGAGPTGCSCTDETGTLMLVYFNVKSDYLARLCRSAPSAIVSGRVEFYNGMAQMPHPDFVLRPDELDRLKPIEPVYPLTAGLSPRLVQRAVGGGARTRSRLPEWIDPALRERRGWPAGPRPCARSMPRRARPICRRPTPARERLAYDEVFASQLAVALVRARRQRRPRPGDRRHGRARPPGRSRARLCADRRAASGDRRDRRRDGAAAAHDAAAARRCRQRQDRGRADGDADRGRERRAGGADGADRDPGAPASGDLAAARRGRPGSRSGC